MKRIINCIKSNFLIELNNQLKIVIKIEMKNKELYPKNNGRKYYLIFQIKKIKNERIYKKK